MCDVINVWWQQPKSNPELTAHLLNEVKFARLAHLLPCAHTTVYFASTWQISRLMENDIDKPHFALIPESMSGKMLATVLRFAVRSRSQATAGGPVPSTKKPGQVRQLLQKLGAGLRQSLIAAALSEPGSAVALLQLGIFSEEGDATPAADRHDWLAEMAELILPTINQASSTLDHRSLKLLHLGLLLNQRMQSLPATVVFLAPMRRALWESQGTGYARASAASVGLVSVGVMAAALVLRLEMVQEASAAVVWLDSFLEQSACDILLPLVARLFAHRLLAVGRERRQLAAVKAHPCWHFLQRLWLHQPNLLVSSWSADDSQVAKDFSGRLL